MPWFSEVVELKNTLTELKNTPNGFNCTLDIKEERISELEEIAVKLT